MANLTEDGVQHVHGMNPQNLIEKIMRNRIYSCMYWKEECFGLTEDSLVEKAMELEAIGGTYGGNQVPTPFLCLLLKMLQLQPEMEIVDEFLQNEDYKYVTALGAMYVRMVGRAVDIYQKLEPLLNDYRNLRKKTPNGWEITHMDEFIDSLIMDEFVLDISLPRLTGRHVLESTKQLPGPRASVVLEEEKTINSTS